MSYVIIPLIRSRWPVCPLWYITRHTHWRWKLRSLKLPQNISLSITDIQAIRTCRKSVKTCGCKVLCCCNLDQLQGDSWSGDDDNTLCRNLCGRVASLYYNYSSQVYWQQLHRGQSSALRRLESHLNHVVLQALPSLLQVYALTD